MGNFCSSHYNVIKIKRYNKHESIYKCKALLIYAGKLSTLIGGSGI